MKITIRQLRQLILESLLAEVDTDVDADIDTDDDPRSVGLAFGDRDTADGPPGTPSRFTLKGGPIEKFLTEPVSTGKYNVGYDGSTLGSKPGGGIDPSDPDAESPAAGYNKMLFVVDTADRSDPDLEPRAAWQNREMHQGQDIFGVLGDPVPAYIHGYVHRAAPEPGKGGKVVTIATAAPIMTTDKGENIYPEGTEFIRYAHLDSIGVEQGEYVLAGQTIGTLGCTGSCGTKRTAPHIHLSVTRADEKGEFNYSARYHRDPYDLFDKSGWVTDRSDLYLSESEIYDAVRSMLRS